MKVTDLSRQVVDPPDMEADVVQGVAILLWASEPESPHRLVTPFFHATAAAALDVRVEIYFSARSVLLLRAGAAALLHASSHPGTVYDAMRVAADHGAMFYACAHSLAAHGMTAAALIPECQGSGGAVQFMARVTDLRWRTLVF